MAAMYKVQSGSEKINSKMRELFPNMKAVRVRRVTRDHVAIENNHFSQGDFMDFMHEKRAYVRYFMLNDNSFAAYFLCQVIARGDIERGDFEKAIDEIENRVGRWAKIENLPESMR